MDTAPLSRKLTLSALVIFSFMLSGGGVTFATPLTSDELFLDPLSLPLAPYPRVVLDPISTAGVLSGNSYSWSTFADVQAVHVLPMLKPFGGNSDPATRPASVPPGYMFSTSDYFYQPTIDYLVDLTNGVATASFQRAGIYHVRLDRANGESVINAVLVGAGTLPIPNTNTAAAVVISGPIADVVAVSGPQGNPLLDAALDRRFANAVDDNGASNVTRVPTVDELVRAVQDAHNRLGRKVHLEIVAHGDSGAFQIGRTIVGRSGTVTMQDFQSRIDNYVDDLSIYACSFASGPDRLAAMRILDASLGRVVAFPLEVSVWRETWGTTVAHGWDLALNGDLVMAQVPEPSSTALLMIGVALLFLYLRSSSTPLSVV